MRGRQVHAVRPALQHVAAVDEIGAGHLRRLDPVVAGRADLQPRHVVGRQEREHRAVGVRSEAPLVVVVVHRRVVRHAQRHAGLVEVRVEVVGGQVERQRQDRQHPRAQGDQLVDVALAALREPVERRELVLGVVAVPVAEERLVLVGLAHRPRDVGGVRRAAAHAEIAACQLAHRDGVLHRLRERMQAAGLAEHVLDGLGRHTVVDDEEEAHLGEGVTQLGSEGSLGCGVGHRFVERCQVQDRDDVGTAVRVLARLPLRRR